MVFSIVIIVLIAAIAYFHYTQGFFSATLSAICAILAAVLAFSFHETVVFSLLKGKVANYAHAMILVALFALVYLILRLMFDNMIPGNLRLPLYVDRAGAAVMGIIVGIFATGILAIAAGALPFGPSTPYARYVVEDVENITVPTGGRSLDAMIYDKLSESQPGQFNAEQAAPMIVPVDDIVVNTVSKLSRGALAGDRPLESVHPSYLDELFGQRLGIQVGASRVALNVGAQQQANLQGVYAVDSIPQADWEIGTVRQPALQIPAERKAGGDALLVVRVGFGKGSDDKDNNVRFSPASVRLVADEKNYFPVGTIDPEGVLRVNLPDDFLIVPGDKAVDLLFQVPREALGLGPAPARGRREEEPAKIANGVFVEVKRMAVFDLSDRAIEPYPGPLEDTVHQKRGIPEAKAAAPKPAAPAASDSPFVFNNLDVSSKLFTGINVGTAGDGDATFGSGSATMKEGKFAKLTINATETLQRLGMGDGTINEFFVPPGMKMVQAVGIPSDADPWAWSGKLGQFELVDDKGNKYKPNGAWAKVKGAQGSDRMVASYNSEAPVNEVAQEEGRPTDVYIGFIVPEGTLLKELTYEGKRVSALKQQV